jgi:dTDP-4-amino-4,6-dideoxygalactose transaminase
MVQIVHSNSKQVKQTSRILVTGGLGFIGGHLVEALLETHPDAIIHVLDNVTYAANSDLALEFAHHDRIRLFVGDVADPFVTRRAMVGCSFVFHAAAETHVPKSLKNEEIFFRTNVMGTEVIARMALELGVSRLVHLSTDEVYGPTFDNVSEDHGFYPSTPYAVSKVAAEQKLEGFRVRGLDVCIARPTNAIGTRQHSEKVVPNFVGQAVLQRDLTIEGKGTQQRCFIPVTDLVASLLLIVKSSSPSQTYNIPGQEQIDILSLAENIIELTDSKSEIRFIADRAINDQNYSICGQKISELGYMQRSSVTEEIGKIIFDYKSKGSHERFGEFPVPDFALSAIQAPSIAFDPLDVSVTEPDICYHKPHMAHLQELFVSDAAQARRFQFGGKYSRLASRILENRLNVPKIELTNSCTAALEVAAIATGVGPGDEVVVPTYTFAATVTAFQRTGASIVFCDVDATDMMLNAGSVSKVVTDRTRVVVPVHYGGGVVEMAGLAKWCRERNILVVEDAAQAYGSQFDRQAAGTFGDFAAFSFHETKLLHCGHGGALAINTNEDGLVARAVSALNRGTNFSDFQNGAVEHYEWTQMGSSFRPTELQCAHLSAQLLESDAIISKRRLLFQRYAQQLDKYMLSFAKDVSVNGSSFAIFANDADQARELIRVAADEGIAVSSHYKPLHISKGAFAHTKNKQSLPNAQKMWGRLCRLPIHTKMNLTDVDRVCGVVQAVVEQRVLEAV